MRQIPLPEVTTVPAYFEAEGVKHLIPGQKAIINPMTNHVFAMASDKYKLIKHEDVLENVENVIAEGHNYGDYTRKISLDREGAQMKATYIFEDMDIPIMKVGDLCKPTIEVYNSYNLTWRQIVNAGVHKCICANQMTVREDFLTFKKKHMPDLYLEDIRCALEGGLEKIQTQIEQWKQWEKLELEQSRVEKIIDNMKLNGKEKEGLITTKEVETGLILQDWLTFTETTNIVITKWIFFNIMTQFLTHAIKKEIRRTQLEALFRKNIYR